MCVLHPSYDGKKFPVYSCFPCGMNFLRYQTDASGLEGYFLKSVDPQGNVYNLFAYFAPPSEKRTGIGVHYISCPGYPQRRPK